VENKIAVFGDADFVMPFSALGVDTFLTSDDRKQAVENAKKIIDAKYALVVVAENVAEMTEDVFSTEQNLPTPCILVVPFTTESKGFATRTLGEALKMATGINILENKT
jgi:vacuolar-type H+-ATPase subunit F/Vma7